MQFSDLISPLISMGTVMPDVQDGSRKRVSACSMALLSVGLTPVLGKLLPLDRKLQPVFINIDAQKLGYVINCMGTNKRHFIELLDVTDATSIYM